MDIPIYNIYLFKVLYIIVINSLSTYLGIFKLEGLTDFKLINTPINLNQMYHSNEVRH
jgi:hypothetical protein